MGPNPIFLVALEGEDMWTRRDSGGAHSRRDDWVRTQGEGGLLQAKERGLRRNTC